MSGKFRAWWHPLNSLYVVLQPGFDASLWQIGDIHESQVYPNVAGQIYWGPTRKFKLSVYCNLNDFPASASESNPLLVKLSDLVWTKGNPHLKGVKMWNFGLNLTYLPIDEFSMSLSTNYMKTHDMTYTLYTAAPAEYGGIIEETVNAKPVGELFTNLTLGTSLFNRKLSIKITPGHIYRHANEGGRKNCNSFRVHGNIDYTIGNCNFSVYYNNYGKYYDSVGFGEYWQQDYWNFDFSYGLGDFYMDLSIENIFNKMQKSWAKFNTPNYSYHTHTLNSGRTFRINLTYTFGYGKKIDKSIDISGPSETSSSIRSANKNK